MEEVKRHVIQEEKVQPVFHGSPRGGREVAGDTAGSPGQISGQEWGEKDIVAVSKSKIIYCHILLLKAIPEVLSEQERNSTQKKRGGMQKAMVNQGIGGNVDKPK